MRHPFDGLNGSTDPQPSRRSALGTLAGTAAGLLGLGGAVSAQQVQVRQLQIQVTTLALGEEGGEVTRALNEQGGAAPVTTEPFGEEAGKVVSRAVPGLEDGGKPATQAKQEEGVPATNAVGEAGRVTTQAVNEEGANLPTMAIREAGVSQAGQEVGLTQLLNETGGPVIPVKPNTTELKDAQLQALWTDLAGKDSARAVQACAALYGSKNAIAFLEKNLTVEKYRLQQADARTVAKLIADLDAEDFDTREKAEADLVKLGPTASAALEKALQESKSAEQKMRLQRLVEAAKNPAGLNQAKRGLEVLVALRTLEARELLGKLAKGDGTEWLTQTARQALERASPMTK